MLYVTLLLTTFIASSWQEEVTDCVAGEFYHAAKKNCQRCKSLDTFSEDGAAKCKRCPEDPTGKHCLCDTTRVEMYRGSRDSDVYRSCTVNEELNCSNDCYIATTKAHGFPLPVSGSVLEVVNIMPCNCNNNKTKLDCERTKSFTHNCFQNACDGYKYYLSKEVEDTLTSCYKSHVNNRSCDKKQCDALRPFIQILNTCNCYHHHGEYVQVKQERECQARKKFFSTLENECRVKVDIFWIIAPVTGSILAFAIITFGRVYAVKLGRNLKDSGEIGKIIPYIAWNEIEALGIAALALKSEKAANVLSDKEIVLKVRFAVLKGCFGRKFVKPQHVILKIFSESQCEQQGVELGIFNSIFDKSKARASNIISVYGPSSNSTSRDLVNFLGLLISRSERFRNLAAVIERSYIGVSDEQPLSASRCRYIMMNHCNELSLSKFMSRQNSLPLDVVLQLCRDIATALHFLHEGNVRGDEHRMIIHCDIKPDNIFVKKRRKTSFILGDFGLSVSMAPGQVFRLKGSTSSFVPPEWFVELTNDGNFSQAQRENVECRSWFPTKIDIYQLGLVLWLALHLKTEPWEAELQRMDDLKGDTKRKKHEFLRRLFTDPATFTIRPSFDKKLNSQRVFCKNNQRVFCKLQTLAEQCWQTDLRSRPSACKILSILEDQSDCVSFV